MDKKLKALLRRRFSNISPDVWAKYQPAKVSLARDRDNEILLYGEIMNHADAEFLRAWWGDDSVMSAQIFQEQLDAITGDVLIRINSPGGDIFETSAILNLISERKKKGDKVNVQVDGMAASAASLIMITGSDIALSAMTSVMIHGAQLVLRGDVEAVQKIVDTARKMNDEVAGLYAKRMTNSSLEEVQAALREETWYSAEEAVEVGLADRVIEVAIDEPGEESESTLRAEAERVRQEQMMQYYNLYGDNAGEWRFL